MIIPAFLLKQEISVEPFEGNNSYGAVFGTSFKEKSRLEYKRQRMKNERGEEIVSTAVVFVRPSSRVKMGDRVTYDGQTFRVVFVAVHIGLSSPSHKEIRLG